MDEIFEFTEKIDKLRGVREELRGIASGEDLLWEN